MKLNITNLVKENHVHFDHYRKGHLYYLIFDFNEQLWYCFPVPLDDVGDATFEASEKAILLMRYIRKAMDEGSFVPHHVK